MKRDRVVKVVLGAAAEPQPFLDLIKKHKDSTESFDITEFLQALPGKEHCVVWKALQGLAEECVQKIAEEGSEVTDEAPPSEKQLQYLSMIGVIVEFVSAALNLEDIPCLTSIRAILQQLHELLLGCLDVVPEIQNKTSILLEAWWKGEREGREEIVPNTILYLVARSLDDSAKLVDVKRVWEMRKSLMLLDFEDPLTLPFKTMLLTCTTRHIYLKAEEGKKFLSFLFGMHPKFVEDLHQTFKSQIPLAPKALLEVYAEVYFRAWRLASGPYLQQLEEHCLQDLMYCAVHAPRAGSRGLFHSLKIFLRYIHSKRTQTGVSKILLRLYSPFLWRSLKVAHPQVRANAAFLLLDAFPLQDPDATREQMNDVLQKQFDAMMDLLVDQSVLVRVTAVTGVCRVLSLYFDLVPFPVMKEILGKLVKELAWDASAIDVRVAVVQGLCVVLENRLSHALMKDLLPLLHPLLHDNSEKVRLAFLELLILVKGMKSLKFWHICSIDDLLARMEVDSAHVVKRIVALMVDAFKPSSSQMVQRCLSLLRLNVGATRRFYQLAAAHLPPGEVVHLILSLQSALVQFIKEDQEATSTATESGDETKKCRDDGSSKRRGAGALPAVWKQKSPPPSDNEGILSSTNARAGDEEEDEEEEGLSVQDKAILCGLLEVAVVLWEEVEDRLTKKTHLKLRQRLVTRTQKNIRIFYDAFTDANLQAALYLLASHLPASSVQFMVDAAMDSLRLSVLSLFSRSGDYTHLLVALVSWKRADDLIELMSKWLCPVLDCGDGAVLPEDCQAKRKNGRRGNKKKAAEGKSGDPEASSRPQPVLALSMLSYVIMHPVCMKALKEKEKFWVLRDMLRHSMDLLEKHLSSSDHSQKSMTFELLRQSLSVYIRMSMHRKTGEEEEGQGVWFVEDMKALMNWCKRILVPVLSTKASSLTMCHQDTSSARRSSRKRKANQSHPPVPPATSPPVACVEAQQIASDVLDLFSDMILSGLTRGLSLESELANFGSSLAGTESSLPLLPSLCKLLYQLCETSAHQELAGITPGPGSLAPTSSLLSSVLSLLYHISLNEPPAAYNKAWYTVRQCVTAIVVASMRASSLSLTPHPLQTYTIFVRSIVEAEAQHIRSSTGFPVPATYDDLPNFVGQLLKQVCKDKQSTRLFGAHLHDYLVEQTGGDDVSRHLLSHLAALHLLHVLRRREFGGEEEFVKSSRCTLKLLYDLTDDQTKKWSDVVEQTKQQVEALQEKLYST